MSRAMEILGMYSQREALAARVEGHVQPWRSWACTASGMYSQREAVRVVAAIWLRFALNGLKLHQAWMRHAIWVGRIPDEELE